MELVSKTEAGDIVIIRIELCSELQPNDPDWLRYYNILFRRTLRLMDFEQNDSSLQKLKQQLYSSSMDIRRSYNTSILPYENRLTLCADVTHKLIQSRTVKDIIHEKRHMDEEKMKKQVSEELKGSIVYTRYNNKTHRIDSVNWDMSPRDRFKKFDGSMITFIDYYNQQYNISISDLGPPLLVSSGRWKKGQKSPPQEPVFLIPQLCFLTGVVNKVSSNHALMAMLTSQTRMSPMNRSKALSTFINSIHANPNVQEEFRPWSMKFDNNCLSVSGRLLKTVTLFQDKGSYIVDQKQQNWLNNSRSIALLRPKPLERWVVLHTENCTRQANRLVSQLKEVTSTMRIAMREAAMYPFKEGRDSFKNMLKKYVSQDTQMVVCVLPNNDKKRYEEIKTFLCINSPTPSQCVVASTLNSEKNLCTIITKIAQQMNCKMGGALWKVDTGLEKTMFIGIDCFHDIVNRQSSIAALVASTKEDLSSFPDVWMDPFIFFTVHQKQKWQPCRAQWHAPVDPHREAKAGGHQGQL